MWVKLDASSNKEYQSQIFKIEQVLQNNAKMKSFTVRIRQRKIKRKTKSHICFLMGLLIL